MSRKLIRPHDAAGENPSAAKAARPKTAGAKAAAAAKAGRGKKKEGGGGQIKELLKTCNYWSGVLAELPPESRVRQ